MTRDDARFYGILLLAFGPMFVAGGWLAAFTDVGALLILVGSVMLLVAPLLLRSLRAAAAAAPLAGLGWGWPFMVSAL